MSCRASVPMTFTTALQESLQLLGGSLIPEPPPPPPCRCLMNWMETTLLPYWLANTWATALQPFVELQPVLEGRMRPPPAQLLVRRREPPTCSWHTVETSCVLCPAPRAWNCTGQDNLERPINVTACATQYYLWVNASRHSKRHQGYYFT